MEFFEGFQSTDSGKKKNPRKNRKNPNPKPNPGGKGLLPSEGETRGKEREEIKRVGF